MLNLHPKETIQKILISTTSRLVGEYETEGLLITHAWPNYEKLPSQVSITANPLCRNAFVVAFETPQIENDKVLLPNYSPMGDVVCAYLAILFGKRFDNHGFFETIGHFRVPHLEMYSSFYNPSLPQNNHRPRIDLGIELNLCEILRIEKIFQENNDSKFIHFLRSAGRFYLQALQTFESQPETAYLNLITCGEILSNYFEYDKETLLDDESKNIISKIESGLDDGAKVAKQIKSKLLQIKRRFIKTITQLLNDYFFKYSESQYDYAKLKKETIEQRVAAAYDLRSRYVHTGIDFGSWVSRTAPDNPEVQVGSPDVKDKEYQKTLTNCPTYLGLERIMRFCLLRFIQLQGIKIDSRLDDN